MSYTEDTLVQQTTAEYLEEQLGWRSAFAYHNEDFGPDSLLGRGSDREVVLERTLRKKLAALNPGLPDFAYDAAVRQITATVASQTLVATNRQNYKHVKAVEEILGVPSDTVHSVVVSMGDSRIKRRCRRT